MSTTVVMPTPAHQLSIHSEQTWTSRHSVEVTEPRTQSKKLELPSFRETFGDLLQAGTSPVDEVRHFNGANVSPRAVAAGSAQSPEYVAAAHSNKRRRVDGDDELDWRAAQVPRYHRSPEHQPRRHLTPPPPPPAPSSSSYRPDAADGRVHAAPPPPLPSLSSSAAAERKLMPPHEHEASQHRPYYPEHSKATPEPRPSYHAQPPPPPPSSYGYEAGPGRYDPAPAQPVRQYERTPFTAGVYGSHYSQGLTRYVEPSYMGVNGNSKPRKRRGNLPKETTDKLRAWFMAHLSHPYPTEDEKQELMHQTKLQMNQISNWFINARRRQLPVMANNTQGDQDSPKGENASYGNKSDLGDDTKHRAQSLSDDESRSQASDADAKSLSWKEHAPASRTHRESI